MTTSYDSKAFASRTITTLQKRSEILFQNQRKKNAAADEASTDRLIVVETEATVAIVISAEAVAVIENMADLLHLAPIP